MNKFRAPSIALMIASVSSALSTQRVAAEPADGSPLPPHLGLGADQFNLRSERHAW